MGDGERRAGKGALFDSLPNDGKGVGELILLLVERGGQLEDVLREWRHTLLSCSYGLLPLIIACSPPQRVFHKGKGALEPAFAPAGRRAGLCLSSRCEAAGVRAG